MVAPVLTRWVKNFAGLFYPDLCLACSRHLSATDDVLCLRCLYYLPQTRYHLEPENPFTERFWGRLRLERGAALFHYVKGGRVQQLIHRFKYNGKREVGLRLGAFYGRQLRASPHFQGVELIIPVPLHPRKQHRRGYNQSELLARGLSQTMGIPWRSDLLERVAFTTTQTRKSRLDRLENVQNAFRLSAPAALEGRHVLLVDDVMTTGATLEACGQLILQVRGTKVSMVTLAMAVF